MRRLGSVVLSCLVAAATFLVTPPADAAPLGARPTYVLPRGY